MTSERICHFYNDSCGLSLLRFREGQSETASYMNDSFEDDELIGAFLQLKEL